MTDVQYGFKKNHSTGTNLLVCEAQIAKWLNNGKDVDLFLFDFQKVFDKVDHTILFKKLPNFGITGKLLDWFADFLHDRKQYVQLGDAQSDIISVTSGVIHGSVCGPQLFSLFKNDLDKVLNALKMYLFADESKSITEVASYQNATLIQQDLNCIEGWSIINKLYLNVIKSYHLHYGNNSFEHEYKLGDAAITIVQLDLGVLRSSETLSYKNHINALYKKVNRRADMMLRTFECRSSTFMLLLWKTYLRSKLE